MNFLEDAASKLDKLENPPITPLTVAGIPLIGNTHVSSVEHICCESSYLPVRLRIGVKSFPIHSNIRSMDYGAEGMEIAHVITSFAHKLIKQQLEV